MAKTPASAKAPATFAVLLRAADRPGLRACGEYLPDRPYDVAPLEAARLLRDKGFRLVNESDAPALAAAVDAINAPATPAADKVEG